LAAIERQPRQGASMRTKMEQEEVADMARFVAPDGAKHATSRIIAVDGNME
jgi:hypothetical protein